jgi:hypothetical protein
VGSLCHKLESTHVVESMLSVVVDEAVKVVRQHIVCCVITGVSFAERTFKKFIQLQVIQNINMDYIYLLSLGFTQPLTDRN